MSWNPSIEPRLPGAGTAQAIDVQIFPRARDLGGFTVGRVLPAARRQMVGPFIFFDQIGPAEIVTGSGIDVRPHPHIGLATVTYLFKGEFLHRDSLGNTQMIFPGELNWMVAGRGITHSERTSAATRRAPSELFGIQTWVALPEDQEESAPSFEHFASDGLPVLDGDGKKVRLILGNAWGERAPARVSSEMFHVDALLDPNARIPLPDEHEDRAIYVICGSVHGAGQLFEPGQMTIFRPGQKVTLQAGEAGARMLMLGGATLSGPRYIWWNFVSSSKQKIEAAKAAWGQENWADGPFSLPPGDTVEFTPLP